MRLSTESPRGPALPMLELKIYNSEGYHVLPEHSGAVFSRWTVKMAEKT